jgi:hypothetical protein
VPFEDDGVPDEGDGVPDEGELDCDALEPDAAAPVRMVCPRNACAASNENSPAATTAAPISHRLIRRINSRPASRPRGLGAAPLALTGREGFRETEARFIAHDCRRALEAIAKQSVSRL